MFLTNPADEADYDDENDDHNGEIDDDEDERPTLADIFNCEDPEDNEEAAADYVRKMQERGDD